MGHANRSWLDYALCVDTQSRGIRLPVNGRSDSNPNPDGYSCRYGDANSYSYRNRNYYSDTYTHDHGYTSSKADSDSTTAA